MEQENKTNLPDAFLIANLLFWYRNLISFTKEKKSFQKMITIVIKKSFQIRLGLF